RFFKRFPFGPLGDLSIVETRQNRSPQVDVPPFTRSGGGFIPVGNPAVDAQLADPSRHLPEPDPLRRLAHGVAQPRSWHPTGTQVVLTPVRFPGAALGAPANLTFVNSDQWDGYLDGLGHGYTLIDVTPERVQADYHHTPRPTAAQPDPRIDPALEPAYAISWQTLAGSRRISPATGPVGPRHDTPTGADR